MGGAHGQIKERMWPSAGDTFHSFHALIAIRMVSVCFTAFSTVTAGQSFDFILRCFLSCNNFPHVQNQPLDPGQFQLILRLSNFSLLGHLKSYSVASRMQKNCVSNQNRHRTVEQSNQSRGAHIGQKGKKARRKNTEASTAWRAMLSPQRTTAMSKRQPLL